MKFIVLLGFLLFFANNTNAQTTDQKVNAIIDSLDLVNNKMQFFTFYIKDMKNQVSGNDSLKLVEIETKITSNNIHSKLEKSIKKVLDKNEIEEYYDFVTSSVFQKVYKQNGFEEIFLDSFSEINDELAQIKENINEKENEEIREYQNNFVPIAADRENGIYSLSKFSINIKNNQYQDVKLAKTPAITFKDIQQIQQGTDQYGNSVLKINLTNTGTEKFREFTSKNLGNPIALVFNHQIIAIPTISSPIPDGSMSISLMMPESEFEEMQNAISGQGETVDFEF